MGYQMNPMEQQMMREALMSGLMSEVDVIMQAYADYDKHYLGILEKAKFEQRVKRVATISEVYIDMSLLKSDLERRLDEIDERINAARSVTVANTWRKLRKGTYFLYSKTSDILKQAEAQIASFRSMALVKSFEQFKSDIETLTGVPQSKFSKIKDKVEEDKENKRKSMKDKAIGIIKRGGTNVEPPTTD
ncbi:MAG: hypothetical protein ACTSPB_17945 [Candidatus Thorarchaeota archaeon]